MNYYSQFYQQPQQQNPKEQALAMFKQQGITIPEGMENNPQSIIQHLMQSGARGRGSNARRDSMGRYSSEDGYSRADAKEDFENDLRELMNDAPDEHTRRKLEKFLKEMR